MAQFNGCDERFVGVFGDEDGCENLTTRMYPFVRTDKEVAELLLKTKADNKSTMVIFTFADPKLRARASRMCELSDLKYVDLLGNMFDVLSEFLQRKPLGAFSLEANSRKPKQRSLSDDYFRRIDAVGKFVPNNSKESTPKKIRRCDPRFSPPCWVSLY
jgi:regulator of PEP synthase PpsR (kinase-PPPase family)